jgi:hypothetical protein
MSIFGNGLTRLWQDIKENFGKRKLMTNKRPWDKYKESLIPNFTDKENTFYMNDPGYEIPEETIVFYNPYPDRGSFDHKEVLESLIGKQKRDMFTTSVHTYCLPIMIGNQYGFVVKAAHDIELFWQGGDSEIEVKSDGWQNSHSVQAYVSDFGDGIFTIENSFILRTPTGINLMTMQPPNYFIKGIHVMTAVIESDNLRRNFAFSLKITNPNTTITIKKGDWLAAFIPVPRLFIDKFKLVDAKKIFSKEIIENEILSHHRLGWERQNLSIVGGDRDKKYQAGRKYFKGIHVNKTLYRKHQKRIGSIDD